MVKTLKLVLYFGILLPALIFSLGCGKDATSVADQSTPRYMINVVLQPDNNTIRVTTLLSTKADSEKLYLHLNEQFSIDTLLINGEQTLYERIGDSTIVDVNVGEQTIRIVGWRTFSPDEVFAECNPIEAFAIASTGWYPRLVDSKLGVGQLHFLLPSDWSIVANGVRIKEETTEKGVISEWHVNKPSSFGFRAGPLKTETEMVAGIPFYFQSTKEDSTIRAVMKSRCADVIKYCTEWFGPYPYESFSIVPILAEDFQSRGGTVQDGLTFWADFFFTADPYWFVIPHEVSHMWWGISVMPDTLSFNLWAEGMAEYFTALYFGAVEGKESFYENIWMGNHRDRYNIKAYIKDWSWRDVPITNSDFSAGQEVGKTKGKYFLWLLHRIIGDSAFFGVLQDIQSKFGGTGIPVGNEEYLSAFEQQSGKNLKIFFDEWLTRTGIPDIEVIIDGETITQGHRLNLTIIQKGDNYHLEVPVAVMGDFDIRNLTLKISDTRTDTTIILPSKPDSVILDPDNILLHWTDDYKVLAEEGKSASMTSLKE